MEVIETRLAKIHTKAQIRSYFQEWEREQQNQLLCSTSSLLIFKSDNSENFKNKEGRSPGNDQLHPNFFPGKNLLLFQLSSFLLLSIDFVGVTIIFPPFSSQVMVFIFLVGGKTILRFKHHIAILIFTSVGYKDMLFSLRNLDVRLNCGGYLL